MLTGLYLICMNICVRNIEKVYNLSLILCFFYLLDFFIKRCFRENIKKLNLINKSINDLINLTKINNFYFGPNLYILAIILLFDVNC